jgi:hypothetical protein
VLTVAYFAVAGALPELLDATLVFPLEGVSRGAQTLPQRLDRIAVVVRDGYLFSGPLLWGGLVLLLLLALAHLVRRRGSILAATRDPLIVIVLTSLAGQVAYALYDFQGYPDLYPFLPYAALGFGGAAALALHLARQRGARRATVAATVLALALLTTLAWSRFGSDPLNDDGFRAQRADACALRRLLGHRGTLYALGDPTSVVMTHRRNPDRFIYLGSGVAQWKLKDLPGGFHGWEQQIRAADPKVVVIRSWVGPERRKMVDWLVAAGYRPARVGAWPVFLRPAGDGSAHQAADRRARRAAVRATRRC